MAAACECVEIVTVGYRKDETIGAEMIGLGNIAPKRLKSLQFAVCRCPCAEHANKHESLYGS